MRLSRITHDRSPVSVVTMCVDCPHWRAFSFDLDEAQRRAANHLIVVHGVEPARIREAATRRATRQRAKLADLSVIVRTI